MSKVAYTHDNIRDDEISCYASEPLTGDPQYANESDDAKDCTPLINVKLVNPVSAKYLKIEQYGTDQGHTWISITGLDFSDIK